MKHLSVVVLALLLLAGCQKPALDPAAVTAHEQLYGPIYTSLREAYKLGTESMRGDVPASQRQSAGPAIVTKLKEAVTELDKLEAQVKSLPDEYATATAEVVKSLKDEALVYITYAEKAQAENPAADPEFMEVVSKVEPVAQVRVRAVEQAEKAYESLPSKDGLTRPSALIEPRLR